MSAYSSPLFETIAEDGDLVLDISHDLGLESKRHYDGTSIIRHRFRVQSSVLRENSPYFHRLLDPNGFEEGRKLAVEYSKLSKEYGDARLVPWDLLPRIEIEYLGAMDSHRILAHMKTFLSILHNRGLDPRWKASLENVVQQVIIADRFDSVRKVRQYAETGQWLKRLYRRAYEPKELDERGNRQRLLIGLFLEEQHWFRSSSLQLIDMVHSESIIRTPSMYWDLPQGIEEELVFRRQCILSTINSLQRHFLALYLSPDRQCRLGYDSSPQCDLYQLGQMSRFFHRAGLVSPVKDTDVSEWVGGINALIASLRQCPDYQIDRNHSHCGIRNRLISALEFIQLSLKEAGICLNCWQYHRLDHAWSEGSVPDVWTFKESLSSKPQSKSTAHDCRNHKEIRDFFTATEQRWQAS